MGLKVLYSNADVLTASKMVELRERVKIEKPHIIAITEVQPKNSSEARMDQDYTVHNFSLHRWCNGRGINIWTHKCLDGAVSIPDFNEMTVEIAQVQIRLDRGDNLTFSCVYRSQHLSQSGNDALNSHLIKTAKSTSHVNICGDFNFGNINWATQESKTSEASLENKFLTAVRDSFMHQHVVEPTRNRGSDEPSLLDLTFTNEEDMLQNLQYLAPLGKSDHQVLTWHFTCYTEPPAAKTINQWWNADYDAMRADLRDHSWNFLQNPNSTAQEAWDELKHKLNGLRDKHVPTKTVGNKTEWEDRGDFPASAELRNLIKEKNRAHKKWQAHLKWPDEDIFRRNYTRIRNKVVAKAGREKRAFERKIAMNSNKENTKQFWALCNKRLKTSKGVAPLLKNPTDPSSLTFDDTEKAEALQRQFTSVFTKEPDGEIPRLPDLTKERLSSLTVTPEVVLKKLKGLKTSKSPGPDGLHPLLLSELAHELARPLAHLYNLTLRTGVVPADWKNATVSPIFKKGVRSQPVNYRPVSLTCILCKIMESIIRESILEFCINNGLLSDNQFGFINGRSTTLQLLNFLEECIDVYASNGVTDVVYLDFAKAFDSVPHRRLLGKLKAHGIDGEILRWIEAFLCGRVQRVSVNGKVSSEESVLSGIPQGSVLGPLLFVLYINDLPQGLDCTAYLFADDTKVLKKIHNLEDSVQLQEDLNRLETWSLKWLLSFHPDKCKILTLGKHENIPHAFQYSLFGTELEHLFQEKDLGVIIDSDITFEDHIACKVKKANSIMGLIRRVFTYLDKDMFKKLFTSLVRSHLEFSQVVWSPRTRKLINLIESVQIRATKLAEGLADTDYSQRLMDLNMTTLAFRRKRGDMIETWKHINVYSACSVPASFKLCNSRPIRSATGRHPFQIYKPLAKDGLRGVQHNSFYYRIADTWNNLPHEVVAAGTLNTFKNRLDRHWSNDPLKWDHTLLWQDTVSDEHQLA